MPDIVPWFLWLTCCKLDTKKCSFIIVSFTRDNFCKLWLVSLLVTMSNIAISMYTEWKVVSFHMLLLLYVLLLDVQKYSTLKCKPSHYHMKVTLTIAPQGSEVPYWSLQQVLHQGGYNYGVDKERTTMAFVSTIQRVKWAQCQYTLRKIK